MKYHLHFTLDYEIHGNGDGNPMDLMVEPTNRLMSMLEAHGQRLTIMADVAEILSFKNYLEKTGRDDFHVAEIEAQLKDAIIRGHDVQLHIHSSWFNAVWNGKKWDQCVDEYNMAALPAERIEEMVGSCVQYLNNLLTPVKSDYKVWLFRAANWSMMPTPNIYCALLSQGIMADTSVYKGGIQGGNVCYDYSDAFDALLSYPASMENINKIAPPEQERVLTEYPIYTEMRNFWAFFSFIRVFRMVRAKFHRHKHSASYQADGMMEKKDNRKLGLDSFFRKSPWKLDFNQARGRQMIFALKRIHQIPVRDRNEVDVVMIGHSKSFIKYNEKSLGQFLDWVSKQSWISSV